jgi:hypothetical protein
MVVNALRELACLHDCDDGDVTGYWNEYVLMRATLLDQEKQGRKLLKKGMSKALASGLIVQSKGTVTVRNWSAYNPQSTKDATATQRKRKERQKKAESTPPEDRDSHGNVTRDTDRDVTRDTPSRARASRADARNDTTRHDTYDTTPHTHTPASERVRLFCQHLRSEIAKAGSVPESRLPSADNWVETTEMRADGVDLDEATKVATWALRESPAWSDGGSWRGRITSASTFWRFYDKLVARYRDAMDSDMSPRTQSMRGDPDEMKELLDGITVRD